MRAFLFVFILVASPVELVGAEQTCSIDNSECEETKTNSLLQSHIAVESNEGDIPIMGENWYEGNFQGNDICVHMWMSATSAFKTALGIYDRNVWNSCRTSTLNTKVNDKVEAAGVVLDPDANVEVYAKGDAQWGGSAEWEVTEGVECCVGNDCSQSWLKANDWSFEDCKAKCISDAQSGACIGIEYGNIGHRCSSNDRCKCFIVSGGCSDPKAHSGYNYYKLP